MSDWKYKNKSNAAVRIKELKSQLDYGLSKGTLNTTATSLTRDELQRAYLDEEKLWKTKSRNNWLQFGDRNTKNFYASAKQRLARNRILAIEDEAGNIQRGDRDIGNTTVQYFTQLFQTTRCTSEDYTQVFEGFQARVTDSMNQELIKPITEEEIRQAVFDIGPDRASGPDGITAAFYQQFWLDIITEVIVEVEEIFRHGNFRGAINHQYIPKAETRGTKNNE